MIQQLKLEKSLSVYTKPKEILFQLDSLVEQSLAQSLIQIEDLVSDQLKRFAESYDQDFNKQNIDFHIQVKDHKFKLIPYNFYTYLLSEGVQVTYGETKDRKYFQTKSTEYYYNSIELYGVAIEKKTVRQLLNEGSKIQRESGNINPDFATSN
jgi:hypothetical protein